MARKFEELRGAMSGERRARNEAKALALLAAMDLSELRSARQVTQEELAERIGVTRQTIGLIEAGKYNPSLKLCLLLARVTKTPLNELFWEEGDYA